MLNWRFIENPQWYELGPELPVVPFLPPDMCREIIAHGERRADEFKPYGPDVENNAAPGQEMRLNVFDPDGQAAWKSAIERIIYPIMRAYWWPVSFGKMRQPFVIRYDPEVQATLDPHHDASLVTVNIQLTNNHEGGELVFPRQKRQITSEFPVGHAVLFPGRVTHVHYVKPVTKGIRYSMVHWISGTSESYEDVL